MPASYWADKKICGNSASLPNIGLPLPPPVVVVTKPIQLIVGIPTGVHVDYEWADTYSHKFILKMLPPNSGVIKESRYGVAQARETITNSFIANPAATHLLFFDTDILPIEMHGVNTLIQDTLSDPKKYIVSGIYYNSLYSGINAWINEQSLKLSDAYIKDNPDPVLPVDKVGMGYCVIRKDLFELLNLEDRPLFYYKIHEGNVMESEDFVFFKKLKKYNIRPYIDSRVTALHIKRCKIDPQGGIMF